MRYRLRTLLIVLAIGPPLLAGCWFAAARWQSQQDADGWDDTGGPGEIAWFEITCTFTEDDTFAKDEPADISDPESSDPFGMP